MKNTTRLILNWTKKLSVGVLGFASLGFLSAAEAASVYYVSCYRSNICQPVYGMPPCDGYEAIYGYVTSTSQSITQNVSSRTLTQSLTGTLTVYGTKAGRPEVNRRVAMSGTYQNIQSLSGYGNNIVSLSMSGSGDSLTTWRQTGSYLQIVEYLSIVGRSSYAYATCSITEL